MRNVAIDTMETTASRKKVISHWCFQDQQIIQEMRLPRHEIQRQKWGTLLEGL